MWKGSHCPWEAVPRSRWCLSPVLPHRWVWSCCLVLNSQQKGQKLQRSEFHNSSCQGGRCSTGRGTWSILASWECQQEAGAGRGARALGREQSSLAHMGVHVWAAPSTPRQCQAAGGSQENAPRVGMARAVLPALPGGSSPVLPGASPAPAAALLPPCAAVALSQLPQLQDSSTSLWDLG